MTPITSETMVAALEMMMPAAEMKVPTMEMTVPAEEKGLFVVVKTDDRRVKLDVFGPNSSKKI